MSTTRPAADRRSYGSKYDASLSLKEIAARIRADIKQAVETDRLSQARYSVRIGTGTMYRAIHVTATDVSSLVYVYNQKRLAAEIDEPHRSHGFDPETRELYSAEASAFLKTLEAIVAAYNHNGSDSASDLSDVNFFDHVGFGSAYTMGRREAEVQDIKDERRNAAERAEVKADIAKLDAPAVVSQADWLGFMLGAE